MQLATPGVHRGITGDAGTGEPLDVYHWLRLWALARDAGELVLPYTSVRPSVWKRSLALGKDKEASRLRAMQLYPGADLRRKRTTAAQRRCSWRPMGYGQLAQRERCSTWPGNSGEQRAIITAVSGTVAA